MSELLEFKLAFLRAALYLAVEKAGDEDINDLQAHYDFLVETIKSNPEDENAIYVADRDFHVALSKACKNKFMYQVNEVIMRISKYSRLWGIRAAINEKSTQEISNVCYCLLEIIKTRDVEDISPTLDNIYKYWKHLLL